MCACVCVRERVCVCERRESARARVCVCVRESFGVGCERGRGVEREGRVGSSQCFLPFYVVLPKRKGDSVTALAGRHEACMQWVPRG